MTKIILVGLITAFSNFASANTLYVDASVQAFCASLPSWESQSCFDQYRNKYFDPSAMNVCMNNDFQSTKRSCLSVIENRAYLDSRAVLDCNNQWPDSNKQQCLNRQRYTPYFIGVGSDSNQYRAIDSQVVSALNAIRQGQPQVAEQILNNLRGYMFTLQPQYPTLPPPIYPPLGPAYPQNPPPPPPVYQPSFPQGPRPLPPFRSEVRPDGRSEGNAPFRGQ